MAQHHQVGVLQNDLHLGNFLIVNDELVTIDGDAVEFIHSLSTNKCYQQLGTLLAQSFPKYDLMLEGLIPQYFIERNIEISRHAIKQVLKNRTTARNFAKKSWIRKMYRESTHFKVVKTFSYQICMARDFVSEGLENKVFELRNTSENKVVWTDKKYKYEATRYSKKLNSERRYLKDSEASICWLNTHLKIFFGENTATPVALFISKVGPFHKIGYFVKAEALPVR